MVDGVSSEPGENAAPLVEVESGALMNLYQSPVA